MWKDVFGDHALAMVRLPESKAKTQIREQECG
jgi:hypothetical protein